MESFEDRRLEPRVFDPKLILKFKLNRRVPDETWRQTRLTVLDSSAKEAAVVFSADEELLTFRDKLSAYAGGPAEDGRTAPYEGLFDAIDDFGPIEPPDRISRRLSTALEEDEARRRPLDVEFWFVPDVETLRSWLREARTAVEDTGGEWLDELVSGSAGIALARVVGERSVVDVLATLDQVVIVDSVPVPRLGRSELAELQALERYADVRPPPDEAPVVGVIDSGVQAGHPLLAPALADAVALHPEFGGQAEDVNGHGTMVSGRTLYGDVLSVARRGVFEPNFWLASVRVLGDDNLFPHAVNWVTAISEAVRYLAENWECKVINLSIGDTDSPYIGGKSTPLASELDSLARQYGLVITVSAGNLLISDLRPLAQRLREYPDYLLGDNFAIIDPAQAASALTIGAISEADGVSPRPIGENLGANAIARADGPAPFTRHGPGVGRSIKPELIADGGNWVVDRVSQTLQRDPAVEVVSTINQYPNRLLGTSLGTSFAAPEVAHHAARLASAYPSITSTTIRALCLQGASVRVGTRETLRDEEELVHALCGYGCVSWARCGESSEGRVVLYAEDSLRPDDFHVYRLPMTNAFTETSGLHRLTVSLAFTPPVRHRRYDYLGYQMEFHVVRGVPVTDVFEMAGADVEDPDAGRLSAYELPMRPTRTERSRGCNQMARWEGRRRPRVQHHHDWYIVVRSLNRWMAADSAADPYSIAVALEVERTDELYAELQAELEVELEAQA